MESLQGIKRRIKGIKNINQITKAMELVAATKMRRSQEIALSSRPYAITALDLLGTLAQLEGVKMPPLLQSRPVQKTLYVLVTSDKGLAGAFNSSVIREFENFAKQSQLDLADHRNTFIAIGQKAASYLERRTPNLKQKFVRVGDYTTVDEVRPLADMFVSGYLNKEWDEVLIFSMHFRSALRQDVIIRKIFPITFENLRAAIREIVPEHGRFAEIVKATGLSLLKRKPEELKEYLIEPSAEVIMTELVAYLVLTQMYHLILEANASEHAARRVAMKNASDNAEDLAGELTLVYNKSRQAAITKEIIEITAGAESMN